MTSKTLRIAVLLISAAIGVFSVLYARRIIEKDFADYLSGIFPLVAGAFILIERYRNAKRIEVEREGSKVIRISAIIMMISGVVILIIKVFG